MAEKISVYSVEYESGGLVYSMWIYGTKLEADTHCENLGLNAPELVNAEISHDFEMVESLMH